jgi:acyl-CoA synthetase (AMP-forming)/AMP-acid ligase II
MRAADLPGYYNAVEILERNLAGRADKIALYSPEREMTFQEVAREANQVGHALGKLGARTGEVVGILCPDVPEWVTSFFGILKIGAVALGMNTLLKPHYYVYVLRDTRARILIVHETLLESINAIRRELPFLEHVVRRGRVGKP